MRRRLGASRTSQSTAHHRLSWAAMEPWAGPHFMTRHGFQVAHAVCVCVKKKKNLTSVSRRCSSLLSPMLVQLQHRFILPLHGMRPPTASPEQPPPLLLSRGTRCGMFCAGLASADCAECQPLVIWCLSLINYLPLYTVLCS